MLLIGHLSYTTSFISLAFFQYLRPFSPAWCSQSYWLDFFPILWYSCLHRGHLQLVYEMLEISR